MNRSIPQQAPTRRKLNPRTIAFLLATAILALRLPLWLLPGPGRDEAAYHYWAHNNEPTYALLLQWAVRLCESLGLPGLWSIRLPVAVAGAVVIFLLDRLLRDRGAAAPTRLVILAAVALNPWQSFSGAILHPDAFFLSGLLAFVLAARRRQILFCTAATLLTILAKPTGLLLVPVAWWIGGRLGEGRSWRVIGSRTALGVIVLTYVLGIEPEMVSAMGGFGRLSTEVPLVSRLGASLLALVFLGGPLLPMLAPVGFGERVKIIRSTSRNPTLHEAEAALAAGTILLLFFLATALLNGQFKGNWILPVAVLWMPASVPRWRSCVVPLGLAAAMTASLAQAVALQRPDLVAHLEATLKGHTLAYTTHAGGRETRVSANRTWSQHLAGYHGLAPFARKLEETWRDATGTDTPPRWIVSDDYGLAAQLQWRLGHDTVRIAIVQDGIYSRTLPPLLNATDPGPLLVLPVHRPPDALWPHLRILDELTAVPHPVTGTALIPLLARRIE